MRALLLAIAVTGIGAGTAIPPAALAQAEAGRSMSVPISPTAPERYVVKKGDTLWDISGMYLNDPWYWPEIWYVNPAIANPHLIFPGDVLYFSYVDGKPRVSLEPVSAARLSPEVRTSDLDGAIRAIPYDLLMDFVGRPSLLDRDQVRNSPYIVGMRNRHIVGSTANEVYGRGLDKPAKNCVIRTMATCSATSGISRPSAKSSSPPAPWCLARTRFSRCGARSRSRTFA
jgi:LysM domain